ncbi:nicolin-1-like [Stegodyphus dumicola]|uniref:nicolin-1-like n=1 Tax=Stegodyphus dumicola TaxID=202533 RepID=UPI0015ADB22D|nr:nicolin-1-like [Stegodyphus dumicola]
MHIVDERKSLEFKARPPVSLFLDDERADYKPGCSVIEISFPEPVTIGEICFRNNYTAYIGLSCKRVPAEKDVKNRDILPWQTSVKHFILMEEPECEKNSQNVFSIPSTKSAIPWSGIVNLRIILKQPSFRWKKFGIEELNFFGDLLKDGKQVASVHSASSSRKIETKPVISEPESFEAVMSSKSRYISIVSEIMRNKQATGAAVGRFEVDGSYDIGHLV